MLAISIPTFNRPRYLGALLRSISAQWSEETAAATRIYIFDNGKDAETPCSSGLPVTYIRNPRNIGGDQNIFQAYTSPLIREEYVWVLGDDELLPPGSLDHTLEMLRQFHPGLLIHKAPMYKPYMALIPLFSSYREFATIADRRNAHYLIAHSLISANVLKKGLFDAKLAESMRDSHYGHFYGIVSGCLDQPVSFCQEFTLVVRPQRAPFHGQSDELSAEVLNGQQGYLEWIKERCALSFEPQDISAQLQWKHKNLGWFELQQELDFCNKLVSAYP